MFAKLYNEVEKRQAWLDIARHGAAFLERHGRDREDNWYFSLDREGRPLIQPYNIFSDCFAAMAFGQLYLATGNENDAHIAQNTFNRILERQHNPKGHYNKHYPGTRPLRNFSLPMILCNLSLELAPLLDPAQIEQTIANGIDDVMNVFYREDLGLILENIKPDGTPSDTFDGRLLNPGHGIEAMWFIMDLGARRQDTALIRKAGRIVLHTLDYAWDPEFGGLYYFMDVKGHPPQQLEWDQKLWWVHLETMIALLKGFEHTGDEAFWHAFKRVHQYAWDHFRDPEFGEWYGYLNRQGQVLLPLKGGKWKGCFHVPRALLQCWRILDRLGVK